MSWVPPSSHNSSIAQDVPVGADGVLLWSVPVHEVLGFSLSACLQDVEHDAFRFARGGYIDKAVVDQLSLKGSYVSWQYALIRRTQSLSLFYDRVRNMEFEHLSTELQLKDT
ncbi:hypothetical protein O6P43_005888 [Quillaja saponaria]|uniref:Uncharacterized protein n=1 Tax=Quillaja saponaria TaxID=32244 RepID=A0AAD7Q738_QUISA|nr:hypothetical protein O6P43_005888 [Quillaja saponaria]